MHFVIAPERFQLRLSELETLLISGALIALVEDQRESMLTTGSVGDFGKFLNGYVVPKRR